MAFTDAQLTRVCKLGKGKATCSFLVFDADNGFTCAKGTGLEKILAQRREQGTMRAQGDNCSGPPAFQTTAQSN